MNAAAASALLPEWNEARVYEALVAGAGLAGFEVLRQGEACLLRSPAAPKALIVNRVVGWGAGGEPCTEAALDDIVQSYGNAGFGIELAAPAATEQLTQWLKARGLRKISTSQVMVRAESSAAAAPGVARARYAAWAQSTGLRVERVGPQALVALARMSCENFKLPWSFGELLVAGTRAPGWCHWMALDGEQPIGASLSYVADGLAWLGWTSVLPSHRGRWVHTGALARQLEDVEAAGCRWVSTESARSVPGRPDPVHLNLRRFGFAEAYLRPTFVRAPVRAGSAGLSV